ncbi:MAG: glycosyltransferase family 2 protein [Bacteroidota bacterium]
MQNVAVVILNFNGKDFLNEFLPIVIQNTPHTARIIVADNHSMDGSILYLQENFPTVQIISLPANYGFAKGYNKALSQIEAEYFILLNSDVEVTPNWLEPLIDQLANPNVAACQPKILSYHRKEYFEYAGAAGGFIDSFGYPICRGRVISNLEKDDGQYDDHSKIFWASGACMAIKSKLFHKVRGFDDDFFAHMEEIDLCWRLQLAGHEIVYTSESVVYHIGGGTLSATNPFKTYLNFRNGLAMVFKNLPQENFIPKIFFRLVLDGIAGLGYLAKGQFGNFLAVIKAHFSFYGQLKSLIQKRNQVKKITINKSNLATIIPKSLIWEYLKKSSLKFSDL